MATRKTILFLSLALLLAAAGAFALWRTGRLPGPPPGITAAIRSAAREACDAFRARRPAAEPAAAPLPEEAPPLPPPKPHAEAEQPPETNPQPEPVPEPEPQPLPQPEPEQPVAAVGGVRLTREALQARLRDTLPPDADGAVRQATARAIVRTFLRRAVLERALLAAPPAEILPQDRILAMTALEKSESFGTDPDTAERFAHACRLAALIREQSAAFIRIPDRDFARARAQADEDFRQACDALRAEMQDYARRIADRTATVEALAHAFSDVTEVRTYPLDAVPDTVRDALTATPVGAVSPVTELPGGLAIFKVLARTDAADRLAKAQAVRERLLAGESFSALAAEVSDCPSGKATGGALGTLRRGSMFPPFEEAAFALPLDTVSPVVATEAGYHIIKVTARDPAAGTVEAFHILIDGTPTVRAVTLARRFPQPTSDDALRERLRDADADGARERYIRSLLSAPDIRIDPRYR